MSYTPDSDENTEGFDYLVVDDPYDAEDLPEEILTEEEQLIEEELYQEELKEEQSFEAY